MSKIGVVRALVEKGALLGARALEIGNHAARGFRSSPQAMAAFASKVPALAGGRINLGSVVNYVRENPVTSIFILMEIADAAEMVADMFAEVPGLQDLVLATDAVDTVDTLTADKSKLREQSEKNRAELEAKIMALPLKAVLEFRDEAEVIDSVLNTMVGDTHVVRMANLTTLRRVLNMPESNFVMYEHYRSLQG